jgi:hypothetical protein
MGYVERRLDGVGRVEGAISWFGCASFSPGPTAAELSSYLSSCLFELDPENDDAFIYYMKQSHVTSAEN